MSSIFKVITVDLRSRASYLPPCPLCSFVGITDTPDIIVGPIHRGFRKVHKLSRCCPLSDNCPEFDTEAEVATWWKSKRQETIRDIATDNRRKNCLTKLESKGFEPIL